MRRRKLVDATLRVPADQRFERLDQRGGTDRIEASLAGQQRRQPFVEAGQQRVVAEIDAGERGPLAQRGGGARPGQQVEPVGADTLQQRRRDLGGTGVGIRAGREADCAETALARGANRSRRPVEADVADDFDAVAEQGFDIGLFQRCGREDARARGSALRFGNGQPLGTGERRSRIEPEAAAAGTDPVGAVGRATPGDAIGECEGDGRT
jgi:hypothetical protein